MRIYFDTCSLNRPLDNRSQLRVAVEAEVILAMLSNCEVGVIELVALVSPLELAQELNL
jgi:hypothetical protein